MSDFKNRYKEILNDLKDNIKDEKQKNFVIGKFQELSIMFMDIIDRLTYITDIRVKEVEDKQKEIESKIGKVQKAVDGIESDIYEGDEAYEFEITCPYCGNEFVTDINSDSEAEVECPECHNIIELDWNIDEESEEHDCPHCNRECLKNQALTYDDESIDEEDDDKKTDEDDEDEDM